MKQFTSGQPNEVFSYGEEVYETLRKYIFLRKTLKPYLESLMEESHLTGLPLIRAMFLEYPSDEECWNVEGQYLFGKDILVAPVAEEGQREKGVYIPGESVWIHAADQKEYCGGNWIRVEAPLDKIPVFYRKNGRVKLEL